VANSQFVPTVGEVVTYEGEYMVAISFPLNGTELKCTEVWRLKNNAFVGAVFVCQTGLLKGERIFLDSSLVFWNIHVRKPR
jgi:hypothetical protein